MSQTRGGLMISDLSESSADRLSVSKLRLWFGVLGGALMWFLHVVMAYLVSEFGCVSRWGEPIWLGLTSVAWSGLGFSVLMVIGTILTQRVAVGSLRQVREVQFANGDEIEDGRALLAQCGVLVNRIFLFIILVQTIPFLFYLQRC